MHKLSTSSPWSLVFFYWLATGSSHELIFQDPNQLASNCIHPCICVQNLCVCSRFHSRSWLQVDQQCCAAQTHSICFSCRRTGRCIPPTDQFSVGIWPYISPPWPNFHEINKRSQTSVSHPVSHSYRTNSKVYQQPFCHGRENSLQADSFSSFRLGLSCCRF